MRSLTRRGRLVRVVRFCRMPVLGRLPLLRRLLTVGAFLACGWLLSGVQAAHAGDDPPRRPAVTEGVPGNVVDSVNDAVRDATAQVEKTPRTERTDAAPPRPDVPAADVADRDIADVDESDVAGKVVAPPRRTAPRPPADHLVPETVRTGVDRLEHAVSGRTAVDRTAAEDAAPDQAVRDGTGGVLGSVEDAVSSVTAEAGVIGATGLVDSTVSGLTSSATTTVVPVADALNLPPLGTAPLSPVTAPITAQPAMLVTGVTAGVAAGFVVPPGYWTYSGHQLGARPSARTGPVASVSAGGCRAGDVFILCARIVSPPFVGCSVRSGDGTRRPFGALCPMSEWSVPEQVFDSSFAGRRHDGSVDSAPAPGSPRRPPSDPGHARPSQWHGDGAGDTARPWEARVIARYVPAWIVAPPAVRNAADEPGFSPD